MSKSKVSSAELVETAPERALVILHGVKPLRHTDLATQSLLGRAASGRRTYISRLNQAAQAWGFETPVPIGLSHKEAQAFLRERYKTVPWHQVRAEHVNLLKQRLLDDQKSHRTINLTLAAVRAVAKEVFLTGQMSGDDLKRIELIKGVTGSRLPAGRHVASGEIVAITEACARDPSAAGVRDQAILALLYACGLRRLEVAKLQRDNLRNRVDASDDNGRFIQLVGKKNKERKNFPDDGSWAAIDDWLALRGSYEGPLFCPVNKGGRVLLGKGMSDQSIYKIVIKRIKEAGLVNRATPHDLRRSFVTVMLDKGKDLKIVADLVGHSSVETTAIYDRRDDTKRKNAQAAMHWPYRPAQSLIDAD
ncbi:MAG: tyrosine-type recombinase/integrase [Gammaproteobacteria bacterium]|nr:tyrosine-type recombinase/integrase [Gammaproteobacteria bacterium]